MKYPPITSAITAAVWLLCALVSLDNNPANVVLYLIAAIAYYIIWKTSID